MEITIAAFVIAAIAIAIITIRRRNSNGVTKGSGGGIHEDHKPNSDPQVKE